MLCEANVIPLIDILLVLLVIFMVIPHRQMGLPVDLPQEAGPLVKVAPPATIIVQIASDGSLRINQSVVQRDELRERLARIMAPRAQRVAFLQGDRSLQFQVVVQVLDAMHAAGASPVGLLTSQLEKNP
jgi:biopolymer transport protein ExbD/biopolymer transport protein TolR